MDIRYQSECWNYVTNQSLHPYPYCFRIVLIEGLFLDTWIKWNNLPVQKKGDNQIVDNYRPVSHLPILVKFFERVILNSIFEYLEKNILCPNKPSFRPSNSCEYQLVSIQDEIYKSFDCNLQNDVRGIFLDISKAFDRMWHVGLIYKIQHINITGNSLKLIESFLSNRSQCVVLNGQSFSWTPFFVGVPLAPICAEFHFRTPFLSYL